MKWVERSLFLIESEHIVPNLLIFPFFYLILSLYSFIFFSPLAEGILLKSLRGGVTPP